MGEGDCQCYQDKNNKILINHSDFTGANERTRTADLFITSELLYQLSYIGTNESDRYYSERRLTCQ